MTRLRTRWWEGLDTVPRREDLFVEPAYAAAVMNTALAGGLAINLARLVMEYDEEWGRDMPVQRDARGLAVMEVKHDWSPSGWAYLISPHSINGLIVPLDVITGIELVLYPPPVVPVAEDRASDDLPDGPTPEL